MSLSKLGGGLGVTGSRLRLLCRQLRLLESPPTPLLTRSQPPLYSLCLPLAVERRLWKEAGILASYWSGNSRNLYTTPSPSSSGGGGGGPPRPPQKHDDSKATSGDTGSGGGGGGPDGNKNGDEDKLSALLVKAFLWMLTAYFFIAVGVNH